MATILPEFKKSNFHPNDPVGHPCFPLPSGTVFNPSGTTGLASTHGTAARHWSSGPFRSAP